ncbi:hypothetical protein BD324DRAFT_611212 [Kockovaella imperatae]|uniref:Uncharacterized protein n=1 Tax=Kockovaella imperatae TaxID=4999 RepID=A0A1Y1USQ2_9TREE|nr:hypothetical protein BD324DRAFT_611212 [Kockovaella imperatae]ORX40554.1 hypothetical protein BD324DRAFT_611212 [Kockovaella imperatae]
MVGLPKSKADFVPKKHHGFQFFIFLCGLLLPPIAVAVRFGVMTHDFWINVFLCICGYFPCHFHNFYIQNIRNNTNRARTPKWALKAGLINTADRERRAKKNQWAKRFDERNNQSTHVGQALEEGEVGDNYVPVSDAERERAERRPHEGLWDDRGDTEYYNEEPAPNQQHWSYPMNFSGAVAEGGSKNRKDLARTTSNGDRWERSRATRTASRDSETEYYPTTGRQDDEVPEWGRDYGSRKASKKDKKGGATAGKGGWASNGGYVDDVANQDGWGSSNGNGSSYGNGGSAQPAAAAKKTSRPDDVFNHEF